MAKKKNKPKKLYDDNGRWVEERGRIKGAIRRTFRLSPQMKEVMEEARVELPPAPKKDGTPGKRPRVRYRCAMCGELFQQNKKHGKRNVAYVQVDHINPAIPLWKPESTMTYDEIVRGIFCSKDNLQVLCSVPIKYNDGKSSCHNKKTNEENYIRKKWESEAELESLDQGYDWNMDNPDHKQWVLKHHKWWSEEYQEYLLEKERKKNEREKRKARKRKKNS